MVPLAIAAIFQNEAPYMKEWIEFHRLMGCEHFYLFDHLSADHFQEVLEPYIKARVVELCPWHLQYDQVADWSQWQCLAYERALYLAKGKVKWLALLDLDEFLFPTRENTLTHCLMRYENCAGIGVNWQLFGTSHVERIPQEKLLIETLHLKLPEKAPQNRKVKSIVRPERVQGCESSHFVHYLSSHYQVNTDRIRFEGRDSPYVQVDTLRINHYQVRDQFYLHSQKIPRCLKWWNAKSKEAWESYYASFNSEHDETIFRFIPQLKERL